MNAMDAETQTPAKPFMRLLATLAVLLFCLQSFSGNKADVDLWGNVGFVHALPWSPDFHKTNMFSFTDPDHTWINHEWLSQYILHSTHNLAGNSGLLALKVTIGFLIAALIYIPIRKNTSSGIIKFLFTTLVISTMAYGFSIRPHLFTYIMIILFLLTLKYAPHRKTLTLIVLPLLGLIWANLHGAFFSGIILLIIYTVAETVKSISRNKLLENAPHIAQLLGGTVLLFAVSFVTPYGSALWKFIAESAATMRPYLSEWETFGFFRHFTEHSDFIALSVISLASLRFSTRPKDTTWICILAVSFLSALAIRRNIPIFAIVACFVVPEHAESVAGTALASLQARLPKAALPTLLCLFIPVSIWYTVAFDKRNPLNIEVPRTRFPTGTVSFIATNNIRGNMLVFFDWAEYCIWNLHPGCKVFLDGRFTDAYSRKTVDDYLSILYSARTWEDLLNKYPVDILLLHRENTTCMMLARCDERPSYARTPGIDNWHLVCHDAVSALFLNSKVHSNLINTIKQSIPINVTKQQDSTFP